MPVTQAQKEHYQRNKEKYRERFRVRRDSVREIVRQKKAVPCLDCGVQYPYYVMEFDHVGNDKINSVARMVSDMAPTEAILKEIAKCEVVCSNCHAERTYRRSIAE